MVTPNKEGLYYLASPYSHPDPKVKLHRFKVANKKAAKLIEDGLMLITPIASSTVLCKAGKNLSGEFWQWARLDLELVARSDGVIVLDMPGWQESIGVAAEILRAHSCKLPVWLLKEDGEYVRLVNELEMANV